MTGPATELDRLEGPACQKSEWATTVINAHHVLVEVDDRNGPRFQDLLDYLRADLAAKGVHTPADRDDAQPARWKH